MSTPPLLSVEGVWKSYPSGEGTVDVLRGVSLRLDAGAAVAIVGPSGSGKSTLLNLIGTLDRPTAGTIALDGRELAALDDRALAAARNRQIGFVFQLHHLLPQCTVLENVLVPTLALRGGRAEAERRARRLLDRVGLSPRLAHRPGALSGGERQRAATVRALVNRPRLLLADEPTGSLDHAAAESLVGLLLELNREENTALILVTHAAESARRTQKVYELQDGVLRAASQPGAPCPDR